VSVLQLRHLQGHDDGDQCADHGPNDSAEPADPGREDGFLFGRNGGFPILAGCDQGGSGSWPSR
jgi:hypothetical protein